MRSKTILCLAAGALLLAGCASKLIPTTQTPLPAFKPIPVQVQQCGAEAQRQGDGYDSKMRDCLWQAVQDGKPATFTTTILTVEGDPISYAVQAQAPSHGPGPRFSVLKDSKDHFGKQGQFTYACTAMERLPYQQDSSRYAFHLTGCAGSDADKEVNF
jgi:hypothetical protein